MSKTPLETPSHRVLSSSSSNWPLPTTRVMLTESAGLPPNWTTQSLLVVMATELQIGELITIREAFGDVILMVAAWGVLMVREVAEVAVSVTETATCSGRSQSTHNDVWVVSWCLCCIPRCDSHFRSSLLGTCSSLCNACCRLRRQVYAYCRAWCFDRVINLALMNVVPQWSEDRNNSLCSGLSAMTRKCCSILHGRSDVPRDLKSKVCLVSEASSRYHWSTQVYPNIDTARDITLMHMAYLG